MQRLAAVLAALAMLAVPASAAAGRPSPRSWATIDECRVRGPIATVGLLAWAPKEARRGVHVTVRIQLQYLNLLERWRPVPGGETAPLGLGGGVPRGETVSLVVHPPATLLRASATFVWRRGHRTLARRTVLSSRGRPTGRYGRPVGYSAGTCAD